MKLEQIKTWCEENNYALVKKRNSHLGFDEVTEIAERVVGISKGQINNVLRNGELAFARFLATTYLYDYYAPKIISTRLNFNHTVVSYAINLRLFHEKEYKYLKPWQQEAVSEFINQIQLLGFEVKEVEIMQVGAREKH